MLCEGSKCIHLSKQKEKKEVERVFVTSIHENMCVSKFWKQK